MEENIRGRGWGEENERGKRGALLGGLGTEELKRQGRARRRTGKRKDDRIGGEGEEEGGAEDLMKFLARFVLITASSTKESMPLSEYKRPFSNSAREIQTQHHRQKTGTTSPWINRKSPSI